MIVIYSLLSPVNILNDKLNDISRKYIKAFMFSEILFRLKKRHFSLKHTSSYRLKIRTERSNY